mgnify:CR=1 FL=1
MNLFEWYIIIGGAIAFLAGFGTQMDSDFAKPMAIILFWPLAVAALLVMAALWLVRHHRVRLPRATATYKSKPVK